MTFTEKLTDALHNVRTAASGSPAVFFFISAAGISQLFYKYIPNAMHLNFLFSFSVVLLCNDRIKAATACTKMIIFCCQIAVLTAMYFTELFTLNKNVELAYISLICLYCICAFIFFFPTKDFLTEFKLRFIHFLVSLLFFGAVYCVLLVIIFFINAIFDLDIVFTESIIFRITNATATIITLTVFAVYRTKPLVHSKFFSLMFQKLLPVLLVPLGILGLIYLIKYARFPYSTEGISFPLYYLVLGSIVICLLMIQHFKDRQGIVRLMLGLLGIASLLFIVALLRDRAINAWKYGGIGFSVSDKPPLHEIGINSLLAVYFFYAALSGKNITANIRTVMAVIAVILFLPVIGFYNYAYFKQENIIKPRSAFTEFILERNRKNTNDSDNTPHFEYFSQYYSLENQPPENVERIIETTKYDAVLVKVDLDLDLDAIPAPSIPRDARCRYRSFLFSMTPDGKSVKISDESDGQIVMLDFYTRIKTDSTKAEKVSDKTPFIYEDQKMKIIVHYAFYSENRSARITFDAYLKKTSTRLEH